MIPFRTLLQFRSLSVVALCLSLAACSDDDSGPMAPDPDPVSFTSDVQPIFNASCAAVCHNASSPNGGLNLAAGASHAQLVGVASPNPNYGGIVRVVAGEPDDSLLYLKLIGPGPADGGQMPPSAALGASLIATIRTWIVEGALDN